MRLFFEKFPIDLQRSKFDVIPGSCIMMVPSSLSETEETVGFIWDFEKEEDRLRVFAIQVLVIVLTINYRP